MPVTKQESKTPWLIINTTEHENITLVLRHARIFGVNPRLLSSLTLCCVGFVFCNTNINTSLNCYKLNTIIYLHGRYHSHIGNYLFTNNTEDRHKTHMNQAEITRSYKNQHTDKNSDGADNQQPQKKQLLHLKRAKLTNFIGELTKGLNKGHRFNITCTVHK